MGKFPNHTYSSSAIGCSIIRYKNHERILIGRWYIASTWYLRNHRPTTFTFHALAIHWALEFSPGVVAQNSHPNIIESAGFRHSTRFVPSFSIFYTQITISTHSHWISVIFGWFDVVCWEIDCAIQNGDIIFGTKEEIPALAGRLHPLRLYGFCFCCSDIKAVVACFKHS